MMNTSLVMAVRTVNKAHVHKGIKCHSGPLLLSNSCITIRKYKNLGTVSWSPHPWNFLKCKEYCERNIF